jgi:dienelactone hydrolase
VSAAAQDVRFLVSRPVLPHCRPGRPDQMVFTGDAHGRCEIFTWDAATSSARQVTDRPGGTLYSTIDADGWVWWFDDSGDGRGDWRVQPFEGGPDTPGLAGVPPGRPAGLAMTGDGTVAIGVGDETGLSVYVGRRGGPARRAARLETPGALVDISPDANWLMVAGRSDSPVAVGLVDARTGIVAAEFSGRRTRRWGNGFDPARPAEGLLIEEDGDHYRLVTLNPGTPGTAGGGAAGTTPHDWHRFDSELAVSWFPSGGRVLVRQDRHGRSRLLALDLRARTAESIAVPPGTVWDAVPLEDDVLYLWTDSVTPPQATSRAGRNLPVSDLDHEQPVPGTVTDLWTPGEGGAVHTLLSLPAPGRNGRARPPLVFLLHGGPADHDQDAYDPVVHTLVANGFAVARVNYRGSTGYGPRWRRGGLGRGGLPQLADLVRVRTDILARGLADPRAVGLWGTSWGGYLALLAAGRHPDLWQAVVAVKPVADSVLAYAVGTPALRAVDEALFGGSPEQVPDRYEAASPISHVAHLRAPLLIVAAENDRKCPPEQIHSYLAALRRHAIRHEMHWSPSGHDGAEGQEHVDVLRRALVHLARSFRESTRPAPDRPPGFR